MSNTASPHGLAESPASSPDNISSFLSNPEPALPAGNHAKRIEDAKKRLGQEGRNRGLMKGNRLLDVPVHSNLYSCVQTCTLTAPYPTMT